MGVMAIIENTTKVAIIATMDEKGGEEYRSVN